MTGWEGAVANMRLRLPDGYDNETFLAVNPAAAISEVDGGRGGWRPRVAVEPLRVEGSG
jgi:hypothetical protein